MSTTILVKFPGQPLSYMEVPANTITEVPDSISGLRGSNVEYCTLNGASYYIVMDRERDQKRLPFNAAVTFTCQGNVRMQDVSGPFAVCKLPKGLMSNLASITQADAQQIVRHISK